MKSKTGHWGLLDQKWSNMPSEDTPKRSASDFSHAVKAVFEKAKISEVAEKDPFKKYWNFLKCILVLKNKW